MKLCERLRTTATFREFSIHRHRRRWRGWESEIKYLRRFSTSCCCVLFSPRCTFERFLSRQFHFAAQIHSVHSFIRSLLLDVIYSASRQRSFTVLTSIQMGRPPLAPWYWRWKSGERAAAAKKEIKMKSSDNRRPRWCLCLIRKFAENSRKISVELFPHSAGNIFIAKYRREGKWGMPKNADWAAQIVFCVKWKINFNENLLYRDFMIAIAQRAHSNAFSNKLYFYFRIFNLLWPNFSDFKHVECFGWDEDKKSLWITKFH